ncbi:hypothetical protein LH61_08700 [Leuconostoc mesenteroides P45]|uniref:two-component system regulatory protein YycI n=1 Tax=Leuconostoc mesenteroides TaxID=1245 RepID=UPI000503BF99|nr:two-component system regulatory protein YycI [Leuconostoc mesenteroides]KGB49767.1 hypothetical protein LH61_08700 [Leuconostoc mesenteroides P45]
MQFRRLKILMTMLFIFLDVFLFFWWRSNQGSSTKVTDANANIISEIKNQKIKIANFNTSVTYASYLAGKQSNNLMSTIDKLSNFDVNINNQTLYVTFNKTSQLGRGNTSSSKKAATDDVEASKIARNAGYRYNPILSKVNVKNRVTYSQYIDNLPVIAKQGLMIFNKDKDRKVTDFTQTKITKVTVLRDERATITEEAAIVALYKFNELNSGDKLSRGVLSYDTSVKVNSYDIYLPVWVFVVTHADGSTGILKINAFTSDNLSE